MTGYPPFADMAQRTQIEALTPGRRALLAGRLEEAGLTDASGAIPLALPDGVNALPGDVLAVWGQLEGSPGRLTFRVESVRRLTRPLSQSSPPQVPELSVWRARASLVAAVRRFFSAEGFMEVTTPLMVSTPGTDVYLEAFTTHFSGMGQAAAGRRYLQTSPEFAMKRLLASGAERIFQICPCFRDGEHTPLHNPEFTMVEWYRAYADYGPIMDDVERLVREVLTGAPRLGAQLEGPFERLSVAEAVARHCGGLALMPTVGDAAALRAAASGAGLAELIAGGSWEDLFHELLITYVEPHLGFSRPTFLMDYPAPLAVLARRRDDDPDLAERFELYVEGIELCNGFTELNDPVEQRARFEHDAARRAALGLPAYPMPEALLRALEWGMPPAGGVALGLDRLLMLTLDIDDIGDVLMRISVGTSTSQDDL